MQAYLANTMGVQACKYSIVYVIGSGSMKISPLASFVLRVSTAIFAVIITAAQSRPDYFGGSELADRIVFFLGLIVSIENIFFSFAGTGQQPSISFAGTIK